jgi:tetratricopeptide (TPR) repeat protein
MGVLAVAVLAAALPAAADESVPDLYRQSYSQEARGDYEGALRTMESLKGLGETGYVATLRTGWLQYLAGRFADATTSYRKAIDQEPQAVEPKVGIMLPLMAARKWKEAEQFGGDVLKVAPGDAVVQGRMAYVQYMLGSYEKAEASYRKVLSGWPANVEMRAGLAWTLLKLHRFQEAKAEFDRVLTIAPDHATAKDGRAAIP